MVDKTKIICKLAEIGNKVMAKDGLGDIYSITNREEFKSIAIGEQVECELYKENTPRFVCRIISKI